MNIPDIISAVLMIILVIAIICFASGQWSDGIFFLLIDAVVIKVGSGDNSGGN